MAVSNEKLMAYLDGELPLEEAREVEAALAADPALRQSLERQRALAATIATAFRPLLDAPVPPRLTEAVTRRRSGFAARAVAAMRKMFAQHPLQAGSATAGMALALGLAFGLFVVQPQSGDFAAGPQGIFAQSALAGALDNKLTSDAEGAARIGISFRDGSGNYCRTFTSGGQAGIACRSGKTWRVVALAPAAVEGPGAYHMAASAMPDAIRDAATAMMAGAPLNAAEEKRARASGWAQSR